MKTLTALALALALLAGCRSIPVSVEVCIMHPTYGKICGTLKRGEVTLTADIALPHDVEARLKDQIKVLAEAR